MTIYNAARFREGMLKHFAGTQASTQASTHASMCLPVHVVPIVVARLSVTSATGFRAVPSADLRLRYKPRLSI